jgi:hypothetical protein
MAVSTVGKIVSTVSRGAHPNLPAPRALPQISAQSQTGLVNVGPGGGRQSGLINVATDGSLLPPGRIMKGYHPNKSTYETRGGGTSRWPQELELHEKGTVLVRNRRMNVGNARALKKALRRAHGFQRLARRAGLITHHYKRPGAKKKR